MSNKYYDLTYLSLQVNTIIVLTLFVVAMNIILVLVDSLNKSALKTYNPETICKTHNLEEFAKKSLIFENHYISSLPCMPARREIFAGRKEFMWRPWGPLEIFDPRMPRIIQSAWFRPHNVSEEVKNLFLVGAGTHPGAGIPSVVTSAEVMAKLIPDASNVRIKL